MAKQKLTPWFPADIEPARNGVYERDWDDGSSNYARWHNGVWGQSYCRPELAVLRPFYSSNAVLPWRGLAEQPKGSAK
jgi:hypothetical protein